MVGIVISAAGLHTLGPGRTWVLIAGNGLCSATIGTSWIVTENGCHGMSSRVKPSAMARAPTTPTSTQSRHPRRGGLGSRGSAQNDLRALMSTIDSILAGPAPVVRRKYDARIDRGLT